ncbi:MAG: beta-glucuronidase [Prevotella sp.]|nr:beta-glucuronidase [Prevotella sp.]
MMAAVPVQAAEVTAPVNIYGRHVTSLNGPWHYLIDQQEMGYYDYRMKPMSWGFFLDAQPARPSDLVEYSFDDCPTMQVPGDWNTQDPHLLWYEGTVWMRRKFNHEVRAGQHTLLYFGAVNYEAIVWVNGKEAGRHVGGFTPFCMDVSTLLRDGENSLVVKVDNKRRKENIPTQIFDWWNYGGITRDVLLVTTPETYIEDYTVQLAKGNPRMIDCVVGLNKAVEGQPVRLSIPELGISRVLTTGADGKARTAFRARPQLWSPDTPQLYDVELTLDSETLKDRIGFRTIETRGRQILLNGKPIFLRGVCAHEETAYTNRRCTTAADADTLIAWAKDMGCNFLRLAHYPHNELAIREAERQGMLLWEELPCYWTIDWENPETYANAERQLGDMMRRDKNRASVIIWSVANETPHGEARDRFLSRLARYAHAHDSTRLVSLAMEVTGASNYVNRLSDNLHPYVDVISFNQYVGWYRDVNDAPKMKWEIPYDKPVIVSEFGGGAVAGLHGDAGQRWTEEFQERLYIQNLAMLDRIDGLAGTTPWVLKDFRSPRRPQSVLQKDFNRKGLVSDQGLRKKAFYVVRNWYLQKARQYGGKK